MRNINDLILEAANSLTGLEGEIENGEIVIAAGKGLAAKANDPEVSDFLRLHKEQGIIAALRDAGEDLADPEIAGEGDFKADCALIGKTIEGGLQFLPKLKGSLSEKANSVLDGHVRQVHEGLPPRLKIWAEGGAISAALLSVFVRAIQSQPVPMDASDPVSVARAVRKALAGIAPGLAGMVPDKAA